MTQIMMGFTSALVSINGGGYKAVLRNNSDRFIDTLSKGTGERAVSLYSLEGSVSQSLVGKGNDGRDGTKAAIKEEEEKAL